MAGNDNNSMTNKDDCLLDIRAVSLRLSVSVRTVQRLDSSEQLPRPIRVGGSVRDPDMPSAILGRMAGDDGIVSMEAQLMAGRRSKISTKQPGLVMFWHLLCARLARQTPSETAEQQSTRRWHFANSQVTEVASTWLN